MQFKLALFFGFIACAAAGTIEPELIQKVKTLGTHDAVLVLPQVTDEAISNPALSILSGDAKTDKMVSIMEELTQAAQAPFMDKLSKLGVAEKAEQFWISNKIGLTDVSMEVIEALAAMKGDFTVRVPITVSIFPVIREDHNSSVVPAQNPAQWGVAKIRAPAAWARTTGIGIVVANIDTGVNGNHVALSSNFGGAWRDPYYNNASPTDTNGHGTHAMGSICGTANGIGVAPGAKWIACRGLDNQGSGTETRLSTCAQFMLTASPRPNVVSNSWGGGQGSTWFNPEVTAWRNAGIIPVFAIGNSGANCRTANSPGDQNNLISVGATTTTDTMASFSSRGRSNAGLQKPEVSAPGNQIISAGTGASNYATMSGTSMACPHVAGAVALIMSTGQTTFAQVTAALQNTAERPTVTAADLNCGTTGGQNYPNQAFGYGRIDVGRAIGL